MCRFAVTSDTICGSGTRLRARLDVLYSAAMSAKSVDSSYVALVNSNDSPATRSVDLDEQASMLDRAQHDSSLAVFCDFDGTFSVQDVAPSLAVRHASERHSAVWERFKRGEIRAWDYNMEVLDGLELPIAALEAFLQTVELDPGARDLVDWCRGRTVPFKVLSDGFDYNLDRLQAIWRIHFAYEANRLRYDGGVWRIQAGAPNPDCVCGTGLCKRARIEAFRRSAPGVKVVHIGNGRVSDTCGALAADVAFAKDTLAVELEERGEPYEPYTDLRDVIARLEHLLSS